MATDYIPRAHHKFFSFQKNIAQMVSDHALAWNISAPEVADFLNSSSHYSNLFGLISNKGSRSASQVAEHNQFRKEFEQTLRKFVNGYLRGNKMIDVAVRSQLGLKTQGLRRRQRAPIESDVMVEMKQLGGTQIKFSVRIPERQGKAALHPEADAVELRYTIGSSPVGLAQTTHTFLSMKAYFTIEFGMEHLGKYICLFARWRNLKSESRSGPWSNLVMAMVV